jgi:hypothetical protein
VILFARMQQLTWIKQWLWGGCALVDLWLGNTTLLTCLRQWIPLNSMVTESEFNSGGPYHRPWWKDPPFWGWRKARYRIPGGKEVTSYPLLICLLGKMYPLGRQDKAAKLSQSNARPGARSFYRKILWYMLVVSKHVLSRGVINTRTGPLFELETI